MPTGSCLCGKTRYKVTGEPLQQAVCHCLTCRKLSGTAYTTNVLYPESKFEFTHGKPKTYTTQQDSGMMLTYWFCPNCGVTLSKAGDADAFKGIAIVQAGSLDDGKAFEGAEPQAELWVSRRAGWVPKLEGKGQMAEFQ